MQSVNGTVATTKGSAGWLNAVAGVLLFIAPWVLGYSDIGVALGNHLTLGALTFVVGILAATVHRDWSWVNVAGGAYTIIAALAFGFGSGAAVAVGIILGAAIGIIALTNALGGR